MGKIKIALDAGHGLHTPGKRCLDKLDPNETREYVLNAKVCNYAEEMLKKIGVDVIRTDNVATDVALTARTNKANSEKCDYFISVHHNAGVNGGSGGGVIVCHYPSTAREKDAALLYKYVTENNGLFGNRVQKLQSRKDLHVLSKTAMGALLLENGFMDSKTDVPIILTDDHAVKTAIGIVDFIKDKFALAVNMESINETVCPYCGKTIK